MWRTNKKKMNTLILATVELSEENKGICDDWKYLSYSYVRAKA